MRVSPRINPLAGQGAEGAQLPEMTPSAGLKAYTTIHQRVNESISIRYIDRKFVIFSYTDAHNLMMIISYKYLTVLH